MMDWLTRNWVLKIIALMLAIGLWYYAVGEEGIEVTRSVPLQIKVKNPQMSILKSSMQNIQVTFLAPRALLSDLTSQDIQAVHEIGAEVTKAGDYSFRLESREMNVRNPQIRVLKIEPEVIQVSLDEILVQKLAVEPNFMGEPAFGFKVGNDELQLNPNAVLVEGPKGSLEQMKSIKTEKIDLVGRTRSFRRTVGVDLPQNLKLLSESAIDVYIPIYEEYEEKKFENIPVKILGSPDKIEHIEIQPEKVSFVLKGPQKQFEKLLPEKILVFVDAASLPPGEHDVAVDMILPESVNFKDDKQPAVKVIIRKK